LERSAPGTAAQRLGERPGGLAAVAEVAQRVAQFLRMSHGQRAAADPHGNGPNPVVVGRTVQRVDRLVDRHAAVGCASQRTHWRLLGDAAREVECEDRALWHRRLGGAPVAHFLPSVPGEHAERDDDQADRGQETDQALADEQDQTHRRWTPLRSR
jgi:hypothetical protein